MPSITLAAAIALAGDLPIHHLKLDAQGVDLSLLTSTDPELLRSKVKFVSMEVVASDCAPLYYGQPRCDEVVATMRALGFDVNPHAIEVGHKRCAGWGREPDGARICEQDIGFIRRLFHGQ